MAMEVALKKMSLECSQKKLLPLCTAPHDNCTIAYGERTREVLDNYVEDENEIAPAVGATPQEIIEQFLTEAVVWVTRPVVTATFSLAYAAIHVSTVPAIEPFTIGNIIRSSVNKDLDRSPFKYEGTTRSDEQLTWGVVRSNAGSVRLPCSHYRDIYPRDSGSYREFLHKCYVFKVMKSNFDLISCLYADPSTSSSSAPLTWSTVPSAFFHSQCLCLAYDGTGCGVRAPQGVDIRLYCLSTLLRDFQRQVSYRPAVTYLDYSVKTRVPVCQFANILAVGFNSDSVNTELKVNLGFILSLKCYFEGLVNKQLNCSETPAVNSYNVSELCGLQLFMDYVVCQGDEEVEVPVRYHFPGDSTLVLVLTYVDVSVRLLTLVTYLLCPQLRNLPGKLLICYQVTALMRLLVVRASLVDLALAVRLDVAFDFSSTLWLTSYLHFLTSSIKTLRLPDSLIREEVRMVLLRYSLLGWALPAALSASFFSMDEAIESHMQFGQLLLVLCNYGALLWNLYMFYHNCLFYYDVKKNALSLKPGVKASTVFTGLLNFALKTAVLSGFGITFRLIFTQIQGLEHVLGYYHVLGTIQGLLLFLLYGCNREARDFWRSVVAKTLPLCLNRQNNTP